MKTIKNTFALVFVVTWFVVCFTGCDSKEGKSTTVITNTVTNYATSYVTNSVTNEVVKEVSVPAEIPKEYTDSFNIYQKMSNATFVGPDQALFQMNDVKISFYLDEAVKSTVLEDQIQAKFELTLRKNGITLNPNSQNTLSVTINGLYNSEGTILTYTIVPELFERQWIFRNGVCHTEVVRVWSKGGQFGTVGKMKANDALQDEIEKTAEVFANDFLSANPK